MNFIGTIDTSAISNHPQIKILQQQKNISVVNTQLERSKLLPNLNVGYSNQSIQGNGNDNKFYASSFRFQSIQFGVGVPLFFGSQKAKINSSKTLELITENKY